MEYRVICTQKREKIYSSGFSGDVLQMFGVVAVDEPGKIIYCDVPYVVASINAGNHFFVEVNGEKAYLRINHTDKNSLFVETKRDGSTVDNLLELPPCDVSLRVVGAAGIVPVPIGFWETIRENPIRALLPFLLGLLLALLFCWLWEGCSKQVPDGHKPPVYAAHDTVYVHDTVTVPKNCPNYDEQLGSTQVHFKFNKSDITNLENSSTTENGLDTLKKYRDMLKNDSLIYVDLTGYADFKGRIVYNDTLAAKRERSIRNYFLQNGVKSKQLQLQTVLGSRTATRHANPTTRAQERKVVIRIYGIQKK